MKPIVLFLSVVSLVFSLGCPFRSPLPTREAVRSACNAECVPDNAACSDADELIARLEVFHEVGSPRGRVREMFCESAAVYSCECVTVAIDFVYGYERDFTNDRDCLLDLDQDPESFADFDTELDALREEAVALSCRTVTTRVGECKDGRLFLSQGSLGGVVDYYDSDTRLFTGRIEWSDAPDPLCLGIFWWGDRFACLEPTTTEAICDPTCFTSIEYLTPGEREDICTVDADCDDGRFCNGLEYCNPNAFEACTGGPSPIHFCRSGDRPCGVDKVCDEEADVCRPRVECAVDGHCGPDEVCFVFACGPGICSTCRAP